MGSWLKFFMNFFCLDLFGCCSGAGSESESPPPLDLFCAAGHVSAAADFGCCCLVDAVELFGECRPFEQEGDMRAETGRLEKKIEVCFMQLI